jgi:hypothetical protein
MAGNWVKVAQANGIKNVLVTGVGVIPVKASFAPPLLRIPTPSSTTTSTTAIRRRTSSRAAPRVRTSLVELIEWDDEESDRRNLPTLRPLRDQEERTASWQGDPCRDQRSLHSKECRGDPIQEGPRAESDLNVVGCATPT